MNKFITFNDYLFNINEIKTLKKFEFKDFKLVPIDLIEKVFDTKNVDRKDFNNFLYFKKIYLEKNNHWDGINDRWIYYSRIINLLEKENIDPKKVLEAGPFGAPVINGCDTIDFYSYWYYPKMSPTYTHDLRDLPWSIPTKKYDWFIALRVFQHLNPVQEECVLESLRISKNIILVIPEKIHNNNTSRIPITKNEIISWIGFQPTVFEELPKLGNLYVWRQD